MPLGPRPASGPGANSWTRIKVRAAGLTHDEISLVGEKASMLHSPPRGMPEAVGQNSLEIRVQWVTWSGLEPSGLETSIQVLAAQSSSRLQAQCGL